MMYLLQTLEGSHVEVDDCFTFIDVFCYQISQLDMLVISLKICLFYCFIVDFDLSLPVGD